MDYFKDDVLEGLVLSPGGACGCAEASSVTGVRLLSTISESPRYRMDRKGMVQAAWTRHSAFIVSIRLTSSDPSASLTGWRAFLRLRAGKGRLHNLILEKLREATANHGVVQTAHAMLALHTRAPMRYAINPGGRMAMTREEFERKIGTILRDHGTGVTADLTDELLAYWNGHAVAYVLICAVPPDTCYEEFAMDDAQWRNWRSWLEAWIEAPMFSVRPEVHNWLSEEPPADAGE